MRWMLAEKMRQLNLTHRYDRFVVTRSDHYYECMQNISEFDISSLQPPEPKLYVPTGSGYRGYNDRFLVAGSGTIISALGILNSFFDRPISGKGYKKWYNVEIEQKVLWAGLGYRVVDIPRVMFTCAVASDVTRHKSASDPVPGVPGLLLKYEDEYPRAMKTCQNNLNKKISPAAQSQKRR